MKIPFESDCRGDYYKLLDSVFDSNFLSEGAMVKEFEKSFEKLIGIQSRAVCNGGAALLCIMEYLCVKNKDVIVPANTFWASAAAAKRAGANIIYADCNREDLCLSLEDVKKKTTTNTKAMILVHIGGHIAFEIEEISRFCKEREIYLIEDCAHAHGAHWNGRAAGTWGFAGAYSFYATKTLPLGEGGIICSKDENFIEWIEHHRNYGKKIINGKVAYQERNGFNFRMNEVTAALGVIQLQRLQKILLWKRELAQKYDQIFRNRVYLPDGMHSGYYKYIVFDYNLREETGLVFSRSDLGPEIEGTHFNLPNSIWIAKHHKCPPIYYGWDKAEKSIDELKSILIQDNI